MIKTVTKHIFVCDMCGFEYTESARDLIPKDAFEFMINLGDAAKNVKIQICPGCQRCLRNALDDKLNNRYES